MFCSIEQRYKILLKVLTALPIPLKVAEVDYVFRERHAGSSKFDAVVLLASVYLLINKLTHELILPRSVLFCVTDELRLVCYLAVLNLTVGQKGIVSTPQEIVTLC